MRTAFIKQLVEEAKSNDKIFLIVGDLGFSVIEEFATLFPDRFLNAGVAEQNMAGIASGMAMEGYHVYIYSIGNFPTLRCMEQIRYDIAYHNLNVKIVAVGGGFAYGSLGASHHATEELGMMRAIPNMIVCAPGDPVEARAITVFSAKSVSPMYIRLGKAGEPIVHQRTINNIQNGQILTIHESITAKTAVMTTGSMLHYAVKFMNEHSIDCSIYSCPFIKPIDEKKLTTIAMQHEKIITMEEHQLSAGFGSALLEQYNDLYSQSILKEYPIIIRRGIKNKFYSISGTQQYLRNMADISLSIEDFNTCQVL